MRNILAAALGAAILPALAAPGRAEGLEGYRWQARPILVFAPGEDDPRLAEQIALFDAARPALEERDNVVIVDTEPDSALRARFAPEGFTVVLVGLDGGEKFRAGEVVPPGVLADLIDGMPMRRREIAGE